MLAFHAGTTGAIGHGEWTLDEIPHCENTSAIQNYSGHIIEIKNI
jgi:2-iminoacetate synthase ThiH